MKRIIIVVLTFIANALFAQDFGEKIVNNYKHLTQIGGQLFTKEIIEIYKTDTTIINNKYNRKVDDKSKGGTYVDTICTNAFYKSLLETKTDSNSIIIDSIISKLKRINLNVPYYNVDWGQVYSVCEQCPFGMWACDQWYYERFALIYMTEKEIKQMISFENGEQWAYMLEDIQNGTLFDGVISTNIADRAIDRRIMQFLINKWSPCQIPEVQKLVKVLEESMPLVELISPIDVIKGTWRGAFGNKTINLTIDYDASIAEAEKTEAKRTRWGMFTDDYFGVIAKSIFEGQPESKAVPSKGYYTDGGKDVRVNLIEQPDTAQWNGEFYLWINRKTNRIYGTWESNNKKLKREFELEKVKE